MLQTLVSLLVLSLDSGADIVQWLMKNLNIDDPGTFQQLSSTPFGRGEGAGPEAGCWENSVYVRVTEDLLLPLHS